MKYVMMAVTDEKADILEQASRMWPFIKEVRQFTKEETHLLWEALSWCVDLEGWYNTPEPGEGPQHTVEQDDKVLFNMKALMEATE